jgi:hypothetical protein
MSALGQKQIFAVRWPMSALPPKADIRHAEPDVDCSIWNESFARSVSLCALSLDAVSGFL